LTESKELLRACPYFAGLEVSTHCECVCRFPQTRSNAHKRTHPPVNTGRSVPYYGSRSLQMRLSNEFEDNVERRMRVNDMFTSLRLSKSDRECLQRYRVNCACVQRERAREKVILRASARDEKDALITLDTASVSIKPLHELCMNQNSSLCASARASVRLSLSLSLSLSLCLSVSLSLCLSVSLSLCLSVSLSLSLSLLRRVVLSNIFLPILNKVLYLGPF
jgi:hypothetical protein